MSQRKNNGAGSSSAGETENWNQLVLPHEGSLGATLTRKQSKKRTGKQKREAEDSSLLWPCTLLWHTL